MSPREYGDEFVHFVVGHLLHVCGTFGFVGDARLAEGLHALVGDSQALAAVAFRVFDADGDGAVTPADLATVLSLAKPFFAVTHVALEAKFAAALAQAGAGVRAGGVREDAFSKTMAGVPMLKAWTLVPVRRAAEWLARRATARAATNAEQATSPPPPPPRLLPPPGRASRREELERAGRVPGRRRSAARATTAVKRSEALFGGALFRPTNATDPATDPARVPLERDRNRETEVLHLRQHKASLRPYAFAAVTSVRAREGAGSRDAKRETGTGTTGTRAWMLRRTCPPWPPRSARSRPRCARRCSPSGARAGGDGEQKGVELRRVPAPIAPRGARARRGSRRGPGARHQGPRRAKRGDEEDAEQRQEVVTFGGSEGRRESERVALYTSAASAQPTRKTTERLTARDPPTCTFYASGVRANLCRASHRVLSISEKASRKHRGRTEAGRHCAPRSVAMFASTASVDASAPLLGTGAPRDGRTASRATDRSGEAHRASPEARRDASSFGRSASPRPTPGPPRAPPRVRCWWARLRSRSWRSWLSSVALLRRRARPRTARIAR